MARELEHVPREVSGAHAQLHAATEQAAEQLVLRLLLRLLLRLRLRLLRLLLRTMLQLVLRRLQLRRLPRLVLLPPRRASAVGRHPRSHRQPEAGARQHELTG